ncbi:biotin transporter BioY [Bdellovibrio bacteriovorus]|uniref:biotin transporter BioY n=1 Tax=Bdellovibrio bacteriovorus TaxID=959 RepID=UPI003D058AF2
MTHLKSQALVPLTLEKYAVDSKLISNVLTVILGSLLLALTAQISVPLPFTPVPVTGQTFGVALLSLLWGRNRAMAAFALYLAEGAVGLPVFAHGTAFLTLGPTVGYLVGMFFATVIVGTLADRGYAKNFLTAFLCCVCGSLTVLGCGLLGLSFFVPSDALFSMGLYPFLPGDLIKNLLASTAVFSLNRTLK